MSERTVRVELEDVVDAMGLGMDVPGEAWLDTHTGSVCFDEISERGDEARASDRARYVPIPRRTSRDDFEAMQRFATSVDDAGLRARLGDALRGRGAFGRFRDALRTNRALEAAWFAARDAAHATAARSWLESLGLAGLVIASRPTPAAAAAPPPTRAEAPSAPPIGLLDLLLFGAPDGKTEVLDGRAFRVVHVDSNAEARRLFERLARELCALFGCDWRRRYVAQTAVFALDRATLKVAGRTVTLEVAVESAVWMRFSERSPKDAFELERDGSCSELDDGGLPDHGEGRARGGPR